MKVAISNSPATIVLKSSLDGQPASSGELVTYTCTVAEAASLSWTAAPVFTDTTLVSFTPNTPSNQRMLSCSEVQAVQCNVLDFQAALTSIGPITNGLADLTSTFSFTSRVGLNGTVVECRGVSAAGLETESLTLIVEGI